MIQDVFARGELSYSQVRALSRVANEDTEEELLNLAQPLHRGCTSKCSSVPIAASSPRDLAARSAGSQTEPLRRLLARRGRLPDVSMPDCRPRRERSSWPPSTRAATRCAPERERFPRKRPPAPDAAGAHGDRRTDADSLVLMADTLLVDGAGDRPGGERYQVVVHVEAETLGQGDDGAGRASSTTATKARLCTRKPLVAWPATRASCA